MKKIKVLSKLREIQFSYNNKLYRYEYRTTPSSGLSYIYKGKEMIYSPYPQQCTEEGYEVYNAMQTQNIK